MSITTSAILERFEKQSTVLLTTFKRDGTPVRTPVSIVVRDGLAYFRTWDTAGKAKRLRNNPEIEVAPSTFRGEPTGPAVRGVARLLDAAEAKPIRRLFARKYPLLQRFLVPLGHKIMRVHTLHYEVTLQATEDGSGATPS
ncbi:MAG TPA: PPOX class F420-dependent oxidoreductase [Streptosporangiaceae bacterium]